MEMKIKVYHQIVELPSAVAIVVNRIDQLEKKLMAKMADFESGFQAVEAETTRLSTYVAQLVEQLKRDDLTDEQETQVLASLGAVADRLKGIGASVETPVPTDPLPPISSNR